MMLIDSESLWLAQTNSYVIAADTGGPAVVVDAPPDLDGMGALLARHDLYPAALLLTHGHIDHVGAAGPFVRKTGVSAYVHPDDDFLTLDPTTQLRGLFGMDMPGDFAPAESYEALTDDSRLELGGLAFDVLHTPGHTPGHCCFLIESEGVLFSGDQLFAGSIGRTDLPGGSFDTLMESMSNKVMVLDDEVIVHPGHGPATSVGRERRTNPFLTGLL